MPATIATNLNVMPLLAIPMLTLNRVFLSQHTFHSTLWRSLHALHPQILLSFTLSLFLSFVRSMKRPHAFLWVKPFTSRFHRSHGKYRYSGQFSLPTTATRDGRVHISFAPNSLIKFINTKNHTLLVHSIIARKNSYTQTHDGIHITVATTCTN